MTDREEAGERPRALLSDSLHPRLAGRAAIKIENAEENTVMTSMNEVTRKMMVLAILLGAWALAPARAQAAEQATTSTAAMDLWEKLALPTPLFIGTPKPVQSNNLEPYVQNKKPAPLLVPKDVALLSLNKEVTSSEKEPVIGELAQVTDGDKKGIDGTFVDIGLGVQWVQIDLGAPCDVYAAVVWHLFQNACAYHDVVVRCADDPDFTTGVKTLFNNDIDNSAGLGIGKDKEYVECNFGRAVSFQDAKGAPARTRYIRLYSNGGTMSEMNHYTEVEVWGKPAK
jgi:hypothetical protein